MRSRPFSPFGPYGREFRETMPFSPLLWRLAMPLGPFSPSRPFLPMVCFAFFGSFCPQALSSRWSVEPFGHFRLFWHFLPQTFLPFSHGTLRTNTDSQDRDSTPDNAQSYLFPKYFGGKFGGVKILL